MPSVRTVAISIGLALALSAAPVAACGEPAEPPPVIAPSDVHLAGSGPGAANAAQPYAAGAEGAGRPGSAGGRRLDAVWTVALYCRLIGAGQFARAGDLCSRRRLWSRRELSSVRGLRLRSAHVYAVPDARTLTLRTVVHVDAGPGCTLPDGLATLLFTLRRVSTAAGGWLISAIAASP